MIAIIYFKQICTYEIKYINIDIGHGPHWSVVHVVINIFYK